ncbi:peptidoglycan-binding domain-containing protein [Streptomyces sp. NBC_00503]|uniref:peptidoglycan-binding domain-containing protein n=1 Tax=Streptomyces sp. NBC_00503 TaxID=2903659 RepID=UPI002E80F0CA|nr:peptidoglycan-binding protein [Streptomyces sp. NBC_00503]WUD79812.1 peptidoglycan-binding protein [Streptomyces sp. NBC_00503]
MSTPPSSATARVSVADPRKQGGSRLAFAVLALLALAVAGALTLLLSGPEQEPPGAVTRPDLSVPVLPARSPGAGEEPAPTGEPVGPTGTGSPARSATAPPAPGPGNSAGREPGPSGSTGASPTPAGAGTLRPGDSGPEVRTLQGRLYAQGFTYVSVTGVYDEQTRRGVTQLQQNRSIKGDPQGVYGPNTRAAFASD